MWWLSERTAALDLQDQGAAWQCRDNVVEPNITCEFYSRIVPVLFIFYIYRCITYFNRDKCSMCYLEYSTDSGHLNDNEFNFFTVIHVFMISLLNDILIRIYSELKSFGSAFCDRSWQGFPCFRQLTNITPCHTLNMQLQTKQHTVAVKCMIKTCVLRSVFTADDSRCATLVLISTQSYKNVNV